MRVIFKNTFLIVLTGLIIISCEPKPSREERVSPADRPVNIVLLIGDGMGLAQVSTTFYFKKEGSSQFQRFPYIGLINTSSSNQKITDSAAGATAFACGVLTYNGAVGVDTAKQPVANIIEHVSPHGYQTGLVATSSITHATPASFFAHAPSRSMNELIAEQLVLSEVDLFIGGGRQFFENREDGNSLLEKLKEEQFEIYYSMEELTDLDPVKKYGVLAAEDGLPPVHEGRGEFLTEATEKALDYLSASQKPFFLMIEGSQIDWGGHANNREYTIGEMLDFDKILGIVLDFADKNGETLVVVTADHETGGMALAALGGDGMEADYNELSPVFSTGGHTATLIPVFATGPGAKIFSGIYKNTEIYHKMVDLLDLE